MQNLYQVLANNNNNNQLMCKTWETTYAKSVKTLGIINYNNVLAGTADSLWPVGADDRKPTRSPTFKPTNHMAIVQCAAAQVENRAKVGSGEL